MPPAKSVIESNVI